MTTTSRRIAPPAGRDDLLTAIRSLGPDPFPDRGADLPRSHRWFYADGDRQLGLLGRIVREGRRVGRHVDYSDNYGRPAGVVRFRRDLRDGEERVELLILGELAAPSDVEVLEARTTGSGDGVAAVVLRTSSAAVEFSLASVDGTPCAVAEVLGSDAQWHHLRQDGSWSPLDAQPGGLRPPHLLEEPVHRVAMTRRTDGLWEAPAPVLGRPLVTAPARPHLVAGESPAEALADEAVLEVEPEVVEIAPGLWSTRLPLAISQLRIDGTEPTEVVVEALVRDVPRRGGFLCSDEVLNTLWSTSAYTLRLCMQGLVVDGIKRDRMPWIGDQALGIMANAFAFGDASIVQDGLTALGRVTGGFVNGIADYSLWWVIAHGTHLRYFGDLDFARREADVLHAFVSSLARHADADGVFRPESGPESFVGAGPGSVFIDWGYPSARRGVPTALQMLWHWALTSAAEVLSAVGHPGAEVWAQLAERLHTRLQGMWDSSEQRWHPMIDEPGGARNEDYADFLAPLAGVHPPGLLPAPSLLHVRAQTPFMRAFAIQAMAATGDRTAALERLRTDWAPMLDAGARTFWEEFPEPGRSPWEMYGRPFGKSLCHAWSSGPAAILPQVVLGLRPTAPGWSEFEVDPELGGLEWASAAVPTPAGHIVVIASTDSLTVHVPTGSTLRHAGHRYEGPTVAVL